MNNALTHSYDELETVQADQLESLIGDCLATGINLLIYGDAGSGKSSIIEGMKDNYYLVQLGAASLCEEMINGIPVHNAKENAITYDKPDWLRQIQANHAEDPNKPQILFIDELTLARPEVMNSLQLLLTARAVPTHSEDKLPDNVVIVSATNTVEETTEGYELSRPLKTRFLTVRMTNTPENYKKYVMSIKDSVMGDLQEVLGEERLEVFIESVIKDLSEYWCDDSKFYGTNPRTIMNLFKMCNRRASVDRCLNFSTANTIAKQTTGHKLVSSAWTESEEVIKTARAKTSATIYPTSEQIKMANEDDLRALLQTIKYSSKATSVGAIKAMCEINSRLFELESYKGKK